MTSVGADARGPETSPGVPASPRQGISDVYPPAHWPALDVARAALLVVDIQRLCAGGDRGMFARAEQLGLAHLLEPYGRRLTETVLPNVRRLLDAFQLVRRPVIHTRIQSSTQDGSDRSGGHVRLGLHVPPGHPDGELLPEIAPESDELVLSKTTSSAFVGTGLEDVLGRLGAEHLVVCGVLTNECVDSTARHAADLGYTVTVVEDGCAAVEHDLHEATVRTLEGTYARVCTVRAVVDELHEPE